MKKTKLLSIIICLIILSVTMTGCILSGTYTRQGNTATMYSDGETIGTATVNGKTMTGSFDGMAFTVEKITVKNNPFSGSWTGTYEKNNIDVAIGNTLWLAIAPTLDEVIAGYYKYNGSTASLSTDWEDDMGIATVSGNNMTGSVEDESFNLSKAKSNMGGCSKSSTNPFIGTWTGIVEGTKIEVVINETAWAFRMFE